MLIYYGNICVDKTKIDDLGLFKNIRYEQADCKPMKKIRYCVFIWHNPTPPTPLINTIEYQISIPTS